MMKILDNEFKFKYKSKFISSRIRPPKTVFKYWRNAKEHDQTGGWPDELFEPKNPNLGVSGVLNDTNNDSWLR